MKVSLDNTVGAVFVGCLLSTLFFGVTITQTVNYFQISHSDGWFVHIVVFVSLIADVVHAVLVAHGTYMYSVRLVGAPQNLLLIPRAFLPLTLLTGISVAFVRCFFVRRIWYLSKKNFFVTGIQVVIMFGSFVAAAAAGIRMLALHTFQQLSGSPWIIYSTMGAAMAADISIACTMCYYLYTSSTGFSGTSSLINTLVLYVVGTGLITVVWDILETTLYSVYGDTLLFSIFFLSLSKLYVNALLASLNARSMMQRRREPAYFISSEESRTPARIPDFPKRSSQFELSSSLAASKAIQVEVGIAVSTDEATSTKCEQV